MTPFQRRALHAAIVAVSASGIVYFWMKYILPNNDPFSIVNHPWQPAMLKLHILASPFLLLVFGIVFHSHVARKLRDSHHPNRRSGWIAIVTFGLMTFSGYLLQVASENGLLRVALVLHLTSGALFVAAYVVHLIISVRLLRVAKAQEVAAIGAS